MILAVAGIFIWDRRYRKNQGIEVPKGYDRTEEVTIDPSNGKRFRIYYNSATGQRFYHEESADREGH
ncbi:MAG: hypothetical protein GX434_02455 [Peptococcaceae bacterium]|nr:hypothetical protein [Peptococcaceae bacterium]